MEQSATSEKETQNQTEKPVLEQEPIENEQPVVQAEAAKPDEAQYLKDELAEAKDKYVRLYAEFENHRRRTAKEKIEWLHTANEGLLKNLLPILDDFERAEKNWIDKETKDYEGFLLIQQKFKKIIEQQSVKRMELASGAAFNADLHEAITQIPAPSEDLKGKIVDVVESGYFIQDKVLRFAKVVVGQ